MLGDSKWKSVENIILCAIFGNMDMKAFFKLILFINIFLLIIILPSISLFPEEIGGVENVFSYGSGLRALGMGGAFTAMEGDASLAYWNPGAMSFNQYKELSFYGTKTIADSYYFGGFYTNPTLSLGTLSLGAMGIYTNGIESYDENAIPITTTHNDYLHYQIMISYGYKFNWGLGVGATAKIEQMRILDYSGTGASFDVGAYFRPKVISWLAIGAVVQDVYGTGIKLGTEYEANTRIYKLGVATNFLFGKKKRTRLSFDLDSRLYTDNYNPSPGTLLYDFSFGTELSFSDVFMIRAGYKDFSPSSAFKNLPLGLSIGLGFRKWGFGIDYVVNFEDPEWQGTAELLMKLGISYRFGKSLEEQRKIKEQKIEKQIQEGIRKATKQYEEKLTGLKEKYEKEREQLALQFDEKYKQKLQEINKSYGTQKEELIADLAAEFEAEKKKAMDELAKKYENERLQLQQQLAQERLVSAKRIQELQKKFEQEKLTITKKIQADESFKSEHYARGLQLFADENYKEALAEFETVARFDPNYLKVKEYINRTKAGLTAVSSYSPQIMELYYKGVDLFVQKKYMEAIKEWKKILKIDPYNKLALRNIKEAEDRIKKLEQLGINK